MKNHTDVLIFHTAICAGASQIALMAEEKSHLRISLRPVANAPERRIIFMENMTEKRRFARMPINISLILKEVTSPYEVFNYDGCRFTAQALNLSPKGIAFKTATRITLNASYSAEIHYKDFNPCVITIRILNENFDADSNMYTYGCRFEGFMGNLMNNPLFKELYNSMDSVE